MVIWGWCKYVFDQVLDDLSENQLFFWILVNTWSLLFQKGTQLEVFAFFSVFCDSWSQYRSDDYVIYICFHLQNIAQLLLGTDFYLTSRNFFWDSRSGLARQIFTTPIKYYTHKHASFSKFWQIRSLPSYNRFYVSYDALLYTRRFLGP